MAPPRSSFPPRPVWRRRANAQTLLGLELQIGRGARDGDSTDDHLPTPVGDRRRGEPEHSRASRSAGGPITDVASPWPPRAPRSTARRYSDAGLVDECLIDLRRWRDPAFTLVLGPRPRGTATDRPDTDIAADTPVSAQHRARREPARPRARSWRRQAGITGIWAEVGTTEIEELLIDLGGEDGAIGVGRRHQQPASGNELVADGVTIAGGGTLNSNGIRASTTWTRRGSDPRPPCATRSSIGTSEPFDRPQIGLRRQRDSRAYSNYDRRQLQHQRRTATGDGPTGAPRRPKGRPTWPRVRRLRRSFHLTAPLAADRHGDPASPGRRRHRPRRRFPRAPRAPGLRRAARHRRRRVRPGVAALLDCIAPDTIVTGKAKVKSKKKRARVSWSFSLGARVSSFECSLDGAAFVACASPFSTKAKRGSHTLRGPGARTRAETWTRPRRSSPSRS